MSADEKLLRLVSAVRRAQRAHPISSAQAKADADALLGELSREYAAQAARIAELERIVIAQQTTVAGQRVYTEGLEQALRLFADVADLLSDMDEDEDDWSVSVGMLRAARRALTPGGEP